MTETIEKGLRRLEQEQAERLRRLGVIESEREQAGAQRGQVVAALDHVDAELGRLNDRLAAAASAVARARAEFDPAAAALSRAAEQQADEQARWWSRQPEWRRSSVPRHLRERIEAELGRRASQRAEDRKRLRQEAAESWAPFHGPPS